MKPFISTNKKSAKLFYKLISKIGANFVNILNSKLVYCLKHAHARTFFEIDYTKVIGENVNMAFYINNEQLKELIQTKTNADHYIIDNNNHYRILFGPFNNEYNKKQPKPIQITSFISSIEWITKPMELDMQLCNNYSIRNGSFIKICIYDDIIALVCKYVKNKNGFIKGGIINLHQVGVYDSIMTKPTLILRSFAFLYVRSDEVTIQIGKDNNTDYWLKTTVKLSEKLQITQYEILDFFVE
ncbi:MAG: hypothetical protein HQK77_15755 [Desulfobacterales bacterium]|nr:hypothetical protein [Desulfobacterales bacterium]